MVDTLTKEKRSWNMSRITGKDTKPELVLRRLLHRAGFRFRVHVKELPGKPDIVLPRYRTVVFVNGCYWHRHPGCKYAYNPKTRVDFWEKKFQGTVERDQKKTEQLKEAGWKVVVVWECDLKREPERVVDEVRLAVADCVCYCAPKTMPGGHVL